MHVIRCDTLNENEPSDRSGSEAELQEKENEIMRKLDITPARGRLHRPVRPFWEASHS